MAGCSAGTQHVGGVDAVATSLSIASVIDPS